MCVSVCVQNGDVGLLEIKRQSDLSVVVNVVRGASLDGTHASHCGGVPVAAQARAARYHLVASGKDGGGCPLQSRIRPRCAVQGVAGQVT